MYACVLCIIIIIIAHINSIEEFTCPKFNRIELHGRLDNFMQTLTLRFQDLCAYDGNKCNHSDFHHFIYAHIPNSNTFQRHCVLSIACPTIQSDLCILCIVENSPLSSSTHIEWWLFSIALCSSSRNQKSEMKTLWCSQCIWHSILSQGKSLNSIYIWNKRIAVKV